MKEKTYKVELTGVELNYIELAMFDRLRALVDDPFPDAGNMPVLRRIQRQTLRKLELLRRPKAIYASYRRKQVSQ